MLPRELVTRCELKPSYAQYERSWPQSSGIDNAFVLSDRSSQNDVNIVRRDPATLRRHANETAALNFGIFCTVDQFRRTIVQSAPFSTCRRTLFTLQSVPDFHSVPQRLRCAHSYRHLDQACVVRYVVPTSVVLCRPIPSYRHPIRLYHRSVLTALSIVPSRFIVPSLYRDVLFHRTKVPSRYVVIPIRRADIQFTSYRAIPSYQRPRS